MKVFSQNLICRTTFANQIVIWAGLFLLQKVLEIANNLLDVSNVPGYAVLNDYNVSLPLTCMHS